MSASPRKRRRHQRPAEINNKEEEDEEDYEDDPFVDISDVDDSDNDPDFEDKVLYVLEVLTHFVSYYIDILTWKCLVCIRVAPDTWPDIRYNPSVH